MHHYSSGDVPTNTALHQTEVWVAIEADKGAVRTMSHLVGEITPLRQGGAGDRDFADGSSPGSRGWKVNWGVHASEMPHT